MIAPHSVDEARIWHDKMFCNKKLLLFDSFLLLIFVYKVGDSIRKQSLPSAFA